MTLRGLSIDMDEFVNHGTLTISNSSAARGDYGLGSQRRQRRDDDLGQHLQHVLQH